MSAPASAEGPGASRLFARIVHEGARMRRTIRKGWISLGACLFAVTIVTLLVGLQVHVHSAGPIEGWVVDRQTGLPIEGAVVTASWQSEIQLPNGRVPKGQIAIREAVTDRNGRFYLKSWGPILSAGKGIGKGAPQLLLFKSGYEYERLNDVADLRQVNMKRFTGNLETYAAHLTGLSSALEAPTGFTEGNCDWQELPLMLRALDEQDTAFRVERLGPLTLTASIRIAERYYLEKGCESVNALLLRKMK